MKKVFCVILSFLLFLGVLSMFMNVDVKAYENSSDDSSIDVICDSEIFVDEESVYLSIEIENVTHLFSFDDIIFFSEDENLEMIKSYYSSNNYFNEDQFIYASFEKYLDYYVINSYLFLNLDQRIVKCVGKIDYSYIYDFDVLLIDEDNNKELYDSYNRIFHTIKRQIIFPPTSILDDNSDTIKANFVSGKFDDSTEILFYDGDHTNSTINGYYKVSDPIVNYIPENYFFTATETVLYGREYGFYINTIYEGLGMYISYLSVFAIKNDSPGIDNIEKYLPKDGEQLYYYKRNIFEFTPLFSMEFDSFIKNSETTKWYNFADGVNRFVMFADVLDYGYGNFNVSYAIKNHNSLNYGDDGYTIENDDGLGITFFYADCINKESNIINQQNNGQLIYSLFSCISSLNAELSMIFDVIDVLLFFNNLISYNNIIPNNATGPTIYNNDIYNQRTGGVIRKCYSLIDNSQINSNTYSIGRNNYSNSVPKDSRSKYYVEIGMNFVNGTNESQANISDLQEARFIFQTTLIDFFSGMRVKNIVFDFNYYFSLKMNISNQGNIMTSNEFIVPLRTIDSGIYDLSISSNQMATIKILDYYGYALLNITIFSNEDYQYSLFLEGSQLFYLVIDVINTSSINYYFNYNNCVDYTMPNSNSSFYNSFSLESNHTKVFCVHFLETGYYDIYTQGSKDTSIKILKRYDVIDYNNDNPYTEDDEEDYNAYIYTKLEAGDYYFLIYNYSSTGDIDFVIR